MDMLNTTFRWLIYWPISRTLLFLAGVFCSISIAAIIAAVAVLVALGITVVGVAIGVAGIAFSVMPFTLGPDSSVINWIKSFLEMPVTKEGTEPNET